MPKRRIQQMLCQNREPKNLWQKTIIAQGFSQTRHLSSIKPKHYHVLQQFIASNKSTKKPD
jgi:hypothetical protein